MTQATLEQFTFSMFSNKQDNKPKNRQMPWANLAANLMNHAERTDKDGPLWSPTIYRNGHTRGNSAVEAVCAAVGDFDNGTTWETVEARLGEYEYVMHSTYSHKPDHPKFRIILPFAKPVPRTKWPEIKQRIDEHVFGLASDPAAKDAARIYYLPSCPPNGEKLSFYHKGQLLDPFGLPEATRPYVNPIEGGDEAQQTKAPLGKIALDFVANGSPLGQQRMRALSAARNYLSAGYSVVETAAAVWRGLQASPQDPERGPWSEKDAQEIVIDLAAKDAPPFLEVQDKTPPRTEMEKVGLGYRFIFPTTGIKLLIDAIRRGSEGLSSEVFVECNLPLLPNQLHWGRLNLASTSARSTLVKYLQKRTEGHHLDWEGMIEEVCRNVAIIERAGEPVRRVGKLPLSQNLTWLVKNFVPNKEGMSIYGEGSAGKSYIALAIGLSVMTGLTIIPGFDPSDTGEILYWDWEASDWRIDQRVKAICAGLGIEPVEPLYLPGRGPLVDNIEDALRICQEYNVKLIIVDSVEMAMAGTKGGSSDPNDAVTRMNGALRLLGRSTILVDHVSKDSIKGTGRRDPIGGIMKKNLSRFAFELRRSQVVNPDGSLSLALYNTKRNDDGVELQPIGLRVEFRQGELWCKYRREGLAAPDLIQNMKKIDQLKIHLLRGERPVSELAELIGTTENSTRKMMASNKATFTLVGKNTFGLVDPDTVRRFLPQAPEETTPEDDKDLPF